MAFPLPLFLIKKRTLAPILRSSSPHTPALIAASSASHCRILRLLLAETCAVSLLLQILKQINGKIYAISTERVTFTHSTNKTLW